MLSKRDSIKADDQNMKFLSDTSFPKQQLFLLNGQSFQCKDRSERTKFWTSEYHQTSERTLPESECPF
jgi:hypothetical protein